MPYHVTYYVNWLNKMVENIIKLSCKLCVEGHKAYQIIPQSMLCITVQHKKLALTFVRSLQTTSNNTFTPLAHKLLEYY